MIPVQPPPLGVPPAVLCRGWGFVLEWLPLWCGVVRGLSSSAIIIIVVIIIIIIILMSISLSVLGICLPVLAAPPYGVTWFRLSVCLGCLPSPRGVMWFGFGSAWTAVWCSSGLGVLVSSFLATVTGTGPVRSTILVTVAFITSSCVSRGWKVSTVTMIGCVFGTRSS